MAGQQKRSVSLPPPAVARVFGQDADRAALVSRFIAEAGRSDRIIAWTCNPKSAMCDVHFGGNHRARREMSVPRSVWEAFAKEARETDPSYIVREEQTPAWWDGYDRGGSISVYYIAHPETPDDHFAQCFTR